jgi:hypothetical protein
MSLRAIIDASSAILLARVGLIQMCCQRFHLRMCRHVFDEVTAVARAGSAELRALAEQQPGVEVLEAPAHIPTGRVAADLMRLHRGERDTLCHFLDGAARFVIIDDGKGIQLCRRHDVPYINALLCPRLFYFSGWITELQARSFSDQIASLGRYSEAVCRWAEACTPSDLHFFMDNGSEDKPVGE